MYLLILYLDKRNRLSPKTPKLGDTRHARRRECYTESSRHFESTAGWHGQLQGADIGTGYISVRIHKIGKNV